MRIAVVIPALNEAGNIADLVAETRFQAILGAESSIIVVDNNSTDGTGEIAQQAGAQVVFEPRRGYGFACAAGVRAAQEAEILVFLDGDYSSLPSELNRVLDPVLADSADLVLGSRVRGHIEPGAMPPHQRFGNWLASNLMRLLYHVEVTDLGPYRAIRADLLSSLDMREMTYGWPTEMMVKAARRKARILEVPVSFCNRRSGRSKVSGTVSGSVLAAYYILGVTLRYAV
jgi:glycosyltransferase involved in cell wall biosynthesis